MRRSLIRIGTGLALLAALLSGGLYAAGKVTSLPVTRLVEQSARIIAAAVGRMVYAEDLNEARALAELHGHVPASPDTPVFVFERPNAPHLIELRRRYRLDDIISSNRSEYEAQLALAAWVGTRFEHGTDSPPGGRRACDTVAVIEAGQRGARYWCEVAAYTMIHAAQAMGWPARMITASTDGYTWEHAVAELWSSEHQKWFVVDTDFNVVFEHAGVPLSAWELVHVAPSIHSAGQLITRRFAPLKEGLAPQDLLRFFAYVHLDFRSDWCTRPLRRASPAGGDLNTRWTARPLRGPALTSIPAATTPEQFYATPKMRKPSL
jgi:hypothetical protein